MLPINHPSSIALSYNGAQAEKPPDLSQAGVSDNWEDKQGTHGEL